MSTLILPPGVKPTADQLSTVHPWDRPGFDLRTLDAEDTRAYWARRQSAIVTATSVSEQVFETAKAAERIRNNRNFARIRVGMAPVAPLPKDGDAAPAGQAGLVLLDDTPATFGGRDLQLLAVDDVAAIDPALFDQLRAQRIDVDGIATPLDPSKVVLDHPEPGLAEILAIEPEEGEQTDREILLGLRRAGAAVKIKGPSPAPTVTRQPVFNPIEVLRAHHRAFNATRMHPLAHAVKLGVVSLMSGMDPPGSLPAGFSGLHA